MDDELIRETNWFGKYWKWLLALFLAGLGFLIFLILTVRDIQNGPEKEIEFAKPGWNSRNGGHYSFREQMLKSLIESDTLKSLEKSGVLNFLGPPDRTDGAYFFYKIREDKIGLMTLHNKTMVVKFTDGGQVEWVKIHQ